MLRRYTSALLARVLIAAILPFGALAQASEPPIQYRVTLENHVHHEAHIDVLFPEVEQDVLETRMSRTSPGRYILHEFAKNVYEFEAADSAGNSLTVSRPNVHQWDIEGHDGTVSVSYTLYGDMIGGTYSGINAAQALLNIPASFLFARGLEERPIQVTIVPPDPAWDVFTQLVPTDDPYTFTAPNREYFMDSPIHLAPSTVVEYEIVDPGPASRFVVSMLHQGTDEEVAAYARMLEAISYENAAVFGEFPPFDYDTFHWMASYHPGVDGDAMEHRNCTVLFGEHTLAEKTADLMMVASHELFHTWNVERLRPKSLEPFDFEGANMSPEMWFSEGVTMHYDELLVYRAGVWSLSRYLDTVTGTVNRVMNSVGARMYSPVEVSMRAPLVDRARWYDHTNLENNYFSYYFAGDYVGLALDLTLRSEFGISMDDYMRILWERFGRDEIPYDNSDLRAVLTEMTTQEFADSFFEAYIFGTELPDFDALLRHAGFVVEKANPGAAWMGEPGMSFTEDGAYLEGNTVRGTPLYISTIARGDIVHTVAGQPITSEDELTSVLEAHVPGDIVEVAFNQRGTDKTASLQFVEDPNVRVVPIEHTGEEFTQEQAAFREEWLGNKSGFVARDLARGCLSTGALYPITYDHCPHTGEALKVTLKQHWPPGQQED